MSRVISSGNPNMIIFYEECDTNGNSIHLKCRKDNIVMERFSKIDITTGNLLYYKLDQYEDGSMFPFSTVEYNYKYNTNGEVYSSSYYCRIKTPDGKVMESTETNNYI
jgi:hypothetical protein